MFFYCLKLNCAHIAALGAFLMTLSLHFKTFKNSLFICLIYLCSQKVELPCYKYLKTTSAPSLSLKNLQFT